jgi:hypothetical protein
MYGSILSMIYWKSMTNNTESKMAFTITVVFTIFLAPMSGMPIVDATIQKVNYSNTDLNNKDNTLHNYYFSKISLPENKQTIEKQSNNDNIHQEIVSKIKEAEERKIISEESMKEMQKGPWKVMVGSLDSVPEIHTDRPKTENHEAVVILPNIGKLYEGVLAYSATADVQPASLYGPVNVSDKKGQLIASMDGGNKWYAVSSKKNDQKIGTWQFAANVLLVHSSSENPFSANYSVIYREVEPSKNAKIDTVESIPFSLQTNNNSSRNNNNNNEQIAIILPPSNDYHSGTLSYTASENIQLMTFNGPLKAGEDTQVKRIYSQDNGKTKYEIKMVDLANKMGTFTFSGNGLAIYSPIEKPFTISYALAIN